MIILINDIAWDTDDTDAQLPTELEVDTSAAGIGDPEAELADWLSDQYGWCVKGFTYKPAPEASPEMDMSPG